MNAKALDEAQKQITALEDLMLRRSQLEGAFREQAKELDAQIVSTRGALAMALTMVRAKD